MVNGSGGGSLSSARSSDASRAHCLMLLPHRGAGDMVHIG